MTRNVKKCQLTFALQFGQVVWTGSFPNMFALRAGAGLVLDGAGGAEATPGLNP